jgi:hypothetical protein
VLSGSSFTTLRVTLVPILGGKELVGDAQLSSDFFDLLTSEISYYVGSGFKSGSVHSGSGSTTRRVF